MNVVRDGRDVSWGRLRGLLEVKRDGGEKVSVEENQTVWRSTPRSVHSL